MPFVSNAAAYYPLNYLLQRPEVRSFHAKLAATPGRMTFQQAEALAKPLVLTALEQKGWNWKTPDVSITPFAQELQGMLAWGEWDNAKCPILHIAPALTAAFLRSDCGDMRIADVVPEEAVTYVHFGPQRIKELTWGEGAYHFEGAYWIHASSTSLRIVLCARSAADADPLRAWRERYDLRVLPHYFESAADLAIDGALADDLADLRKATAVMVAKGAMSQVREAEQLAQRMVEDHPAFGAALRLVLNAMAYRKVAPADIVERWPQNTPERLLKQVVGGSPAERTRAARKLWSVGHVPIQCIGEHFTDLVALRGVRDGHALTAHWRQGHWRRQAWGPQMSLRKLIWIQPTMVGAEASSD